MVLMRICCSLSSMLFVAHRTGKLFLLFFVQRCVCCSSVNEPSHHLQLALKACLIEAGLSGRAFAKKVGVNNSLISRLGEHRVDSESLAKMLRHFGSRPDQQLALLRAHLWDEVIRVGLDPGAMWSSLVDGDLAWLAKLPPSVQADLEVVGEESMINSGIRFSITGIAGSILRGRAEQCDRDSKLRLISDQAANQGAADAPASKPRKNIGAPAVRPSLPPKPKAS